LLACHFRACLSVSISRLPLLDSLVTMAAQLEQEAELAVAEEETAGPVPISKLEVSVEGSAWLKGSRLPTERLSRRSTASVPRTSRS
jgi:hypothetical protein